METAQTDLVLVPLDRQGASVLADAAQVGLDGADEETTGLGEEALDAGFKALTDLRRALAITPEAEVAVVSKGIAALNSLLSHYPDGGELPGGELEPYQYTALSDLLALLRDAEVDRVE